MIINHYFTSAQLREVMDGGNFISLIEILNKKEVRLKWQVKNKIRCI